MILELEKKSLTIIDSAVESTYKNKQTGVWALFSGGHDSLISTFVASKHPLFRGVLHVDTGIGIPETTQYVKDICKNFGWELRIKKPNTTYEMLVVKWGFPTPGFHSLMYRMLKERALLQAKKEIKKDYPNEIPVFATGVRKQESQKRAKAAYWNTIASTLYISHIADYLEHDLEDFISFYDLPRNKVKDLIGISGECLCGAHASQKELELIKLHFPEVAKRIENLQSLVSDFRVYYEEHNVGNIYKNRCLWGNQDFEEFSDDETNLDTTLCSGCATESLNREMKVIKLINSSIKQI